MGRPKLSLPLGEATVLEHVIATLRQAGDVQIAVVLGPHGVELEPVARASGAHALILPEATPDMRATVQHGLAWLLEHHQPCPDDLIVLVPADHPTLNAGVVQGLIVERAAHPEATIF